MAGGNSSHGSYRSERLAARDQINRQRGVLDNLFVQSQDDQIAAIDAAISGAQSYAAQQANAKTASQGMGASTIDGTMGYVLQNLIPQAMQMKAGIYANTAGQRAKSIEDYLQLLNQNASLGSHTTQKPNYLGSALMGAAMLANPVAGLFAGLTQQQPTVQQPVGSPVVDRTYFG